MSVLCEAGGGGGGGAGCVLSHAGGAARAGWRLRADLFRVPRPYGAGAGRTRKRPAPRHQPDSEATEVKKLFESLKQELKLDTDEKSVPDSMEQTDPKELSKKIFEATSFDFTGQSGKNTNFHPVKVQLNNELFIIPPKSRFLCGDVLEQVNKLRVESGCKFDMLVADPPWWNKYIRRLKSANHKLSYSMMYNHDVASIPVKHCLSQNCLVAVWCTNSPSNIKAVNELIFPAWGVEYAATWYWMKVTNSMKPICDFGTTNQKQPYERIIIGKVGNIKDVPNKKIIISVPSLLHSHKPPLLEVLTPYLEVEEPQTLELFARYLLPNTVSVGYEPLKWQHISLYQEVAEPESEPEPS